MRDILQVLRRILMLLVVLLLLASTVVGTGSLFGYFLNKKPVQYATDKLLPNEAEQELLQMQGDVFYPAGRDGVWRVENKKGDKLGILINSTPYAKDVRGFGGKTPVFIVIGNNSIITKVIPAQNHENPQLFKKAKKLLKSWVGLNAQEGAEIDVDVVSGATYSSQALMMNMRAALTAYAGEHPVYKNGEPVVGWPKALAVIAVLLIGMYAAVYRSENKTVYVVQCILNIGVLGFWTLQYLSLAMFRSWFQSGINLMAFLPLVIIFVFSIAMQVAGKKDFYCQYVCPYGAMQELAAKVSTSQLQRQPSAKVANIIRKCALAALLIVLWVDSAFLVLDYSPFNVFNFQIATTVAIVLGIVFVVASFYVKRLWCRVLCPLGELLSWIN